MELISAFNNKEVGRKRLEKVTESKTDNKINYKEFNFYSDAELAIQLAILRGEFNISGLEINIYKKKLELKSSKICRLIKRLNFMD